MEPWLYANGCVSVYTLLIPSCHSKGGPRGRGASSAMGEAASGLCEPTEESWRTVGPSDLMEMQEHQQVHAEATFRANQTEGGELLPTPPKGLTENAPAVLLVTGNMFSIVNIES